MDITPQNDQQQPISDDQELAQALSGVIPGVPEPIIPADSASAAAAPTNSFDEATLTPPTASADPVTTEVPLADPAQPAPMAPVEQPDTTSSQDLSSIKKDALSELRPLIDRVELPAEEKFDTYLMLIRSTDDSSLIASAYATARTINDEKRRAEAFLDIIKEIDYLSRNDKPTA
jgi:hypothetical protein